MARPIRIANCSGYFGDRATGMREMVEGGPIDVLTGDWLAELTMLILARTRAKRKGGGYARTFVTQLEEVMGTCLERGIKVVSNAGGLDPDGCADELHEIATRLGLSPKIAYVRGDDLMPRLAELVERNELRHFETGEPIADPGRFLTANAYLGCWGIVDALSRGADIVVTGRATDAAIVCGPAAWHHGWKRTDFDALAGAVVAGHLIECSSQVTGGNYAFFDEVPGLEHIGFPWAEIASDGSSLIGKHDGTGGQVSLGTVTSQLLYEIGGARYFGPDVTARFDTIRLEETARDRVRVFGVRGEPPPDTLKVCMNRNGGFRNDMRVAVAGLDAEKKAEVLEAAFWRACPYPRSDYQQVTTRLLRTEKSDPASNEEALAIWHISVKDPDEKKVGRAFSNAVSELALSSIPGFFTPGGGPSDARPFGVYEPARVPAALVPQEVALLGGESKRVDSVIPRSEPTPITPAAGPGAALPNGPTRRTALGRVVGARSGDKGGNANLGVFVRSDPAWAWLDAWLTSERLQALLPELAAFRVERHRFPALRSLNFVVFGLLEEGVAAATRQDAQAKSLGEWLRARYADVPESLL